MTLRDYYKSLPESQIFAPRQELVQRISRECGVTVSTARNWLLYGFKPRKESQLRILAELTGISPEDMWDE